PTLTPTPTPNVQPVKLGFVVQPTKSVPRAEAQTPITPAPRVAIQDANGNTVTTATNAVTLSLGSNPGGAMLSGTLTVNAVNGIAIFDNVFISRAAAGYTLVATAEGLASATSVLFVVQPLDVDFVARRDFLDRKSVV